MGTKTGYETCETCTGTGFDHYEGMWDRDTPCMDCYGHGEVPKGHEYEGKPYVKKELF